MLQLEKHKRDLPRIVLSNGYLLMIGGYMFNIFSIYFSSLEQILDQDWFPAGDNLEI
jgi:hypothetical protein